VWLVTGSRLIEVLKRFLEPFFPRRPTREDLQTRGIYKGRTLILATLFWLVAGLFWPL